MGTESSLKNIIPYLLLILLLLFGISYAVFGYKQLKQSRKIMLVYVILTTALLIQNFLEYELSIGPPHIFLRTIISSVGYMLRPIIIVLPFYLIQPLKKYGWAWILTAVNAAVYLTALFSHIAFWIREDNRYKRGPLNNTCLIISFVLLAYSVCLVIQNYRHDRRKNNLLPLVLIGAVILGIYLDIVSSDLLPVSYLTVAVTGCCISFMVWLLMRSTAEYENMLLKEKKTQMMLSQIQPHFLFNTLSTIRALCVKDSSKAVTAIEQLSAYLRQNIDLLEQSNLIPVSRELEHTFVYSDIESLRFPYLNVEYDIEDEDYQLPPLTIQPLVENAIRHGVRGRKDGRVYVQTRLEEGSHVITIRDNGTGFDPDQLNKDEKVHIGLANVRDRIEQICNGSMYVDSAPGKGTTITLKLPADDITKQQL